MSRGGSFWIEVLGDLESGGKGRVIGGLFSFSDKFTVKEKVEYCRKKGEDCDEIKPV